MISMLFPLEFRGLKIKTHYKPTDQPTDRPSYRDAWTHLKIWIFSSMQTRSMRKSHWGENSGFHYRKTGILSSIRTLCVVFFVDVVFLDIEGIKKMIKNKFVRTKMRPKEGTKIELQRDLSDFVRFIRFSGLDLSDLSDFPISDLKKNARRTNRPTDGPTDGQALL